ncbi:hypothetical protein [Emticicia agri]|uniref:Uncharacterized protein n=1 Tax=Emticicia agri TaxID=2492393 RepID=A0A4Q5LTU2_9BACT|nr:hypothetical protein [Emticicia agri]RYU92984.1 hypothetical protein EWM59_24410 [Emticicia agri]
MGNLHFTATIDAASFNKTLTDIEKRIKQIGEPDNGEPFLRPTSLLGAKAFVQTFGEINSGVITLRSEFRLLNQELKEFDTTPMDESLEDFKKRIEEIKNQTVSLTAYLLKLNEEYAKLGSTEQDTQKKKILSVKITEVEDSRKKAFDEFITKLEKDEKNQIKIQGKYNDLRAALDKQYADKKTETYDKALRKINEDEKIALQEAIKQNSEAYKELGKTLIGPEDEVLKSKIKNTRKVLAELSKSGLQNSEEYKKQFLSLIELQEKLLRNQIGYLSSVGKLFSGIKKENGGVLKMMSDLGDVVVEASTVLDKSSKFGKIISERNLAIQNAKEPVQVAKAVQDSKEAINKEASLLIVEKAIEFINDLAAAIQQYDKKKKAYYQSVAQQQAYYNKLLNDEIRLKTESENIFAADTGSQIEDAISARTDALEKFNSAMDTLNDSGKAKDGVTVGLSGKNFIKGITSGLFGVAKLFETEDKLVGILDKYPALYDKAVGGVKGFNKELAQSLIASNAVDEATKQQLQTTLDWVNQYDLAQKQLQDSILSLTGQVGEDLKNALVDAFKTGQSAAEALGNTIDKIIENIVIQTLYTELLKPVITQFGKDVEASYGVDENGKPGDGTIEDDLNRFYANALPATDQFLKDMELHKNKFKDLGFDIFNKTDSNANGLSGSIKSITEETAGVLEGQMNAIRMTQATNLEVNRSQLLALTQIANNSEYLKHLELLKSIDKKLSTTNELRAAGIE